MYFVYKYEDYKFPGDLLLMVVSLQAARKEGKPGTNQIVELLYETALMSSGFVVSKIMSKF